MKEYKKISSQVYESTKPVATSIGGDLEYYYNLIKDIDGNILEAGVGTGRLLIPYIQKGLILDGVDLSEHMLDICRQNCKNHNIETDLYLQDLKNLDIDKKYDAIIMPTGSFCLITDIDDMYAVLKSFKEHLTNKGKLILDLSFPTDFKEGETASLIKLNDNTNVVLYTHSISMDLIEQKTYSINKYEKWVDDKLVDTEIAEFNMNWYGIREFIYILKDVGFKDISFEFGYGLKDSDGIVTFIAK